MGPVGKAALAGSAPVVPAAPAAPGAPPGCSAPAGPAAKAATVAWAGLPAPRPAESAGAGVPAAAAVPQGCCSAIPDPPGSNQRCSAAFGAPLFAHPYVDPDRTALEAECLAQPPLQEPPVAGLQKTGGE